MAVVPALTDFTFVEEKKGRLFVNTPNALEGNRVEKCDSASAQFQSEETGLVDGIGTEEEILGQIRTLSACFQRTMKRMTASRNAQMT